MEALMKMEKFTVNGIQMILQDLAESGTLPMIALDIEDNAYGINDISDPKVIFDIGAHVGMVSIYLAKLYPNAHIYAVEPFPLNIQNLELNVKVNECSNITILPYALTKNARPIDLGCFKHNTGGVTERHSDDLTTSPIKTITLDELLAPHEQIDFLKLDIEAFEYEVLPDFKSWHKIKDAGIELHKRFQDNNLDYVVEIKEWLKDKPITGFLWTPPLEAFIDRDKRG